MHAERLSLMTSKALPRGNSMNINCLTAIAVALAAPRSVTACGKQPVGDSEPGAVADDAVAAPATLQRMPSPAGARVFFITPADGATLTNPVRIEFGIDGMAIVKAGSNQPDSGHHHLLVDTGLPDVSLPIPADDGHRHFGDGSSSVELALEPGEHTLRLLLGDYRHIPHDPPVASDSITIRVE